MRVRQWAVVGAALVAAWAGGAGVASASPVESGDEGCLPALISVQGEGDGGLPFPDCGTGNESDHESYASVGCDGVGVLEVVVWGAEPGEEYTLVPDGSRTVRSEPFAADEDGYVDLYVDFTPSESGVVHYEVQRSDENPIEAGEVEVENTCQGEGHLVVTGDCVVPETLTLVFSATGLLPNSAYTVVYSSEGFVPADGEPVYGAEDFETDDSGAGRVTTTVTEDDEVSFPASGFTVDYEVYLSGDLTTSIVGSADAEACPVDEGTHPTPTTSVPATTTPAAVVVQPVAQHPAVLANTGTPTAAIALVGGGLLVVGTGALVATRRRA